MKLYWCPQTRAFGALWMIEETGLPYERVKIDIRTGAQNSDSYRAVNPMGKVPALQDGELHVAETGAICAYLAERAPQAELAPAFGDPMRGRYWQWLFFSGNCIEPALAEIFLKFEVSPGSISWGGAEKVFNVLEAALQPGPWILGERFCAADVMLGTYLNFAINLFKAVPMRPTFDAYLQRCTARPAFQRTVAIDQAG